jgi:hypothetical protein
MEDVPDVSHRPFDPRRPPAGLDEASERLIGEVAEPVPAPPGQPARIDSEDVRNGTADRSMICEPLIGRRHVEVTERRTARDFAAVVRWRAEAVHPDAEQVVPVMGDLDTHEVASLYEAFEPGRARRIAERLEVDHAPRHGSWPDMAAIEPSVPGRQCLGRRVEARGEPRHEVSEWERPRDERGVAIRWRSTTADARIKLRRPYPSVQ